MSPKKVLEQSDDPPPWQSRQFLGHHMIDTFVGRRAFQRGEKDPENEFKVSHAQNLQIGTLTGSVTQISDMPH